MAADKDGFFEDWPKWSKPVLALSAMILLGGVWIGVPLLSAWKLVENNAQATGFVDYRPMMAVLIAMTTATIAGIFLFMTFRIDRGTRLKAERVTKEKVDEVVALKFIEFDKDAKSKIENKLDELTNSKAIEQAVQDRIPEETFRSYVQAVLLANANGRIVAEYAKERARAMDTKAAEALLGLLDDTVKHVRQCVRAKRQEDRRRRWAKTREAIVERWRQWRRAVVKPRD